jgi:hypothetical protein
MPVGLARKCLRGAPRGAADEEDEAMAKTREPWALVNLAVALSALAVRLEPGEASGLTARAARLLTEAMGKTSGDQALYPLACGLSMLAVRLEPAEVMKAARVVVGAMGRITDTAALASLAEALSALAGKLEPGEASSRAILAARAIGERLSPPTRLSGLATLLQASRLPPCRFSPQELVELLKMPTCVGPAR